MRRLYFLCPMRLPFWNYSHEGMYFLTFCTYHRENLFGEIIDNHMVLNKYGFILERMWRDLKKQYHEISLDAFVVMPNHFHGIIFIKSAEVIHELPQESSSGAIRELRLPGERGAEIIHELRSIKSAEVIHELPQESSSGAIRELRLPGERGAEIIHELPWNGQEIRQWVLTRRKMLIPKIVGRFKMRTAKIINSIRHTPGTPVWAFGYHDCILRSHENLLHVREYITNNPANWLFDTKNRKCDILLPVNSLYE